MKEIPFAKTNPVFAMLADTASMAGMSEQEYMAYGSSIKNMRHYEKTAMAKLSIDAIAEATGLSCREVEEL